MSAPARRLAVLRWQLDPQEGATDAPAACGTQLQPGRCRAAAAAAEAAAATSDVGRPAASPVVLVGGMVMDVQAHPSGPANVQRGGSVPGSVTQLAGGVARNVAEALARLQRSAGAAPSLLPTLVSAVGDDLAGRALLQHWQGLGCSAACIAVLPGGATPTVAVVFDLGGEVAACVADVALLEARLKAPLLRRPAVAAALVAAPVAMLDGNLAPEAIEEACRQAAAAGVPVWFEPVSVPKSVRATSLLPLLTYVSPNEAELAAMAAAARKLQPQRPRQQRCQRCQEAGTATAAASAAAQATGPEAAVRGMAPDVGTLLQAGVRHVVLTLGAHGAALCTLAPGRQHITVCHVPALPASVVNCSGAGDCLVAGCLFALAQGLPAEAALAHGMAAAREAVQGTANVPAGLDAAAVRRGAREAAARSRVLQLPLCLDGCCA